MLRAVGSVVLGFVTLFVVLFVLLCGAYLVLGAEGAFQSGSYDVSSTWIVVWVVASFAAAITAGYVCVSIAKRPKPAFVFAGLYFALMAISAIPMYVTPMERKERTGDVSTMDAMSNARPPWWIPMMIPVLGTFGALVGARMKRA